MSAEKSSKIKSVIWVVLMDKKKQKITAGRECDEVSAGELRDAVCRKLRITSDGAEAFSIWICSPLLQLQLKPSHYPTAICDLWYDLLAQFAPVSERQANNDLPIIMLMRNVFYPLSQEKLLVEKDSQARYYLTAEAMFNFLTGRYPVEDELAYKLAALQLKMEGKKLHNFPPGSLQNIANQILPWDVIKRKKKQPLFIDKRIRSHLNDLNTTTPGTLDHMYISHIWTQTCYRCAFFQGQTEVQNHRRDVPIRVGITPHNVFIWNKVTNKTIAEFDNKEIDTKLVKNNQEKGENGKKIPFDVWLINFTVVARITKRTSTAVPIFSKQACMMQTMYERMNDESHLHADKGSTSVRPAPIIQKDHINEVDALMRSYDFSNPTLKIGSKEVPVGTRHISKKENLRGVMLNKKGNKLKKTVVKQTVASKYDV
ncbi:FERM domain-containing protein 8-like isoform X2 [Bolinopsis microptera]|uniref:FERM domain-containing protein 8-like isoform X2 n=1 Tax=Bolinopsis microptera TaxID=2820187 RepID=UPI0030798DAB